MDHAEARELLELAAAEPDGLDRLAAGDTADAAALAGHLAGCEPCSTELERLRLLSVTFREILAGERGMPDDEPDTVPAGLRERTLAYVREVGRDRSVDAVGASGGGAPRAETAVPGPAPRAEAAVPGPAPRASGLEGLRRPDMRALGRWAALAAAVVVAAGLSGFVVSRQYQATIDRQDATIAALARVGSWTVRIGAEPDTQTVALAGPSGSEATGTLLFSPSSGELVVVMNGVAEPPVGQEYRCWVEVDGTRQAVGKMHFGGDLGYWVGPVEGVGAVPSGAMFGVSLVDATGRPVGDPILIGRL